MQMSSLRDASLYPVGEEKIHWVRNYMPLLTQIGKRFEKEKPFKGLKISLCGHVEAKTAYLAQTLMRGGAKVTLAGSNPLSTQDDVAAALAKSGVAVYAKHGTTEQEYLQHLEQALLSKPDIIMDEGGEMLHLLHGPLIHLAQYVRGGCEESTTGVMRIKSCAKAGWLEFPMFAINDARCKYLLDNRYGTGQSVWDGIMRATNLLVAGKLVVIAGYGWCGRGIAQAALGLGAKVIVTETNPVRALEAVMDGHQVMPMMQAASMGDIFITATGCWDIITSQHFAVMKPGAVLCNAGHFDVEVDVRGLRELAIEITRLRPHVDGYRLPTGQTIYLLAEGRLVNMVAGDGHPPEILDMSFALQALCAEHIAKSPHLTPAVYPVPVEIDHAVALMKLQALGCDVDTLTAEQADYLAVWEA